MAKRKTAFEVGVYPNYDGLFWLSIAVKDRKSGDVAASIGADVSEDDIKQMIKPLKKSLKNKEDN